MTDEMNPALKTGVTVIPKRESGARRRKLRKWVLGLTLFLTILGPLIFIGAALGAKIGLWDWRFGLGTLTREVGPKILVAGLVMSLISLILAFVMHPRKGFTIAVMGLIVPIAAFVNLKSVQKTVASLPFIHDITTDTQDVPKFGALIMAERAKVEGVNTADYVGKMAPTQDTNGNPGQKLVSVLQIKAYPDIRPLVSGEPKDVIFGRAEVVAEQLGWKIKVSDLENGLIEATDTTFWYGFEDDVIIRLRNSEGGGTLIDVRSLSRVGGSDLGKNADRIRAFLDKMKAAE